MNTTPINNSASLTAGQYVTLLALANSAISATVSVRFVLQDLTQNAAIRLAVCPEDYVGGATPAITDWIIPVGNVIGPAGLNDTAKQGICEIKPFVLEPGQKLVAFSSVSVVTVSTSGFIKNDAVTIPSAGPDVLIAIDNAVEEILGSNIQAKVNAAVPPAVEIAIADSITVQNAVGTAVAAAMVAAKTEITAAVLLALKTGPVQYDAAVYQKVIDKGTVTTGTVTFNVSQSSIQKVTVGGNITVAITGWPAAGIRAEIQIELVTPGAYTVGLPAGVLYEAAAAATPYNTISSYLTALGRSPAALKTVGSDSLYYWSDDGGVTVHAKIV